MSNEEKSEQGAANGLLGTIAEATFQLWCAQANLTFNQSKNDEEGWDFFVQRKSSVAARRFLDKIAPAFTCLIQVKGTGDPSGAFHLTLSNALKLVKAMQPTFVVTAHVQEGRVKSAWLVHCGTDMISRTLKAVADESNTNSLNKRTLTFRPKCDEVLQSDHLCSALERHIGDLRAYMYWKENENSEVGYGVQRVKLQVRYADLSKEQRDEELACFLVGIGRLAPDRVDVFDLRFGFERLEQTIVAPEMWVPEATGEPDVDIFVRGAGGETVLIRCHVRRASAYAPFLPASVDKVRFTSEGLDFLIEASKETEEGHHVKWSVHGLDEPLDSEKLAVRARAAKVLRLVRCPGTCLVIRPDGMDEIEMPLGGEWSPFEQKTSLHLQAIEDYVFVSESFSVPPFSGELTRSQLLRLAPHLKAMASLLRNAPVPVDFLLPRIDTPLGLVPGNSTSMLVALMMGFEEHVGLIVVAFAGVVSKDSDEHYAVRSAVKTVLRQRLCESLSDEDVLAELGRASDELEKAGLPNVFIRAPQPVPAAWLPPVAAAKQLSPPA